MADTLPLPTEIDFRSAEFIANPYPYYRMLRERSPILYRPDWKITFLSRYDDINTLLRDRRLGRQFDHVFSREMAGLPPIPPAQAPFHRLNQKMLMDKEPPEHTRLKNLVLQAFTPRRVEQMRPRLMGIADGLAKQARRLGRIDLLEQFAAPLSVTIIADMLGVPTSDRARLRPWSSAIVAMYELGNASNELIARQAVQAVEEFSEYLRHLIDRNRHAPGDDLLSALIVAHDRGDHLSEDELIATCILLLNAGHEATVNALGNGFLALLRHPQQYQLLRSDMFLLNSAVEEMLRYDTPLPIFRRWVLHDLEFGGVTFRRGMEVAFLLASANRDSSRFEDAEEFKISRQDNPHLSFGSGAHYCLGAPLARAELQVALLTLLNNFEKIEIVSEPVYKKTFVFRGLQELIVDMG